MDLGVSFEDPFFNLRIGLAAGHAPFKGVRGNQYLHTLIVSVIRFHNSNCQFLMSRSVFKLERQPL